MGEARPVGDAHGRQHDAAALLAGQLQQGLQAAQDAQRVGRTQPGLPRVHHQLVL